MDMRRLLRAGNPSLTLPLVEELLTRIKLIPDLLIKKNCLSLLSELWKWALAETLWKIGNDTMLDMVGIKFAEVKG